MAATYTVPSSGTYTSARNGGRYRYPAGAVIAMSSAVDLGMPGAALPASDTETTIRLADLADVTITDPQDGDVLTYVADWTNA